MAKGPSIKSVESLIVEVYIKKPGFTAKKIRDEVEKQVRANKEQFPNPKKGWPGLSAVQKQLTKSRIAEENLPLGQKAVDKPWSIGASVGSQIPPEATKDLFDIWRASLAMGHPISVRQAKWLVHIRDLVQTRIFGSKVVRNLWLIRQSWLYSIRERASLIMGERYFDTTNLDAVSFMSPWEYHTALRLGRISAVAYPQEALAKIEKYGTSLKQPSVSVKSVEQAVWFDVRAEPPQRMDMFASGDLDEVLQEEDDLVAAYWLTHLSKGPLWNNLPEQPDIQARLKHRHKIARSAQFDLGPGPDDSLYSRQLSVRRKLLDWVKTDSIRRQLLQPVRTGSFIEEWALANRVEAPGFPTPPFNATLLKMVGYEVTPEQMKEWLNLHKKELLAQHKGFPLLTGQIQERFITDQDTPDDRKALEEADSSAQIQEEDRQKAIEQEFMDMVKECGEPVDTPDFWEAVREKWFEQHRSAKPTQDESMREYQTTWQKFRDEYERIRKKRRQQDEEKKIHT